MTEFPIRLVGERHFHPFHLLIDAASESLIALKEYSMGGETFALSTILLSTLAIEALANSVGDHKVDRWNDYLSSNTNAKLRVISGALEVDYDAQKSPWREARDFARLRNLLVHPKPVKMKIDKEINEENLHELLIGEASSIEEAITRSNAELAFKTVNDIKDIFLEKLDFEKDGAFFVPH